MLVRIWKVCLEFVTGCLEIHHESSMPYAQQHYPFENKEQFESTYPADFVSEGIDQTRGWFYTLLVLGTHLFGKAPWKNLIVTGLVLAGSVASLFTAVRCFSDRSL